MVNQIYPHDLQLNKANISDTEAPFLDLHLSVANGFVSSKFIVSAMTFDIVDFPFFDGDVPRRASYGVYISQLIKPASNFVLLIVPSRYFCSGSFCFMSWCLKFFVLLAPYVCFHIFS